MKGHVKSKSLMRNSLCTGSILKETTSANSGQSSSAQQAANSQADAQQTVVKDEKSSSTEVKVVFFHNLLFTNLFLLSVWKIRYNNNKFKSKYDGLLKNP